MALDSDFSPTYLQQLAQADVARALAEDVGSGDLTASLINPQQHAQAHVLTRQPCVLCGAAWVEAAFKQLDPQVQLTWQVPEGGHCVSDQVVLRIQGLASALLSAERVALNFLQLLSAVASKTAAYVAAIHGVTGNRAQIVDTRKTLPGLRLAQKYAVHCGGGSNHRLGLYDAVLIKENHIAAAGSIASALTQAAQLKASPRFIEIEVETLDQLDQALEAGATMVLLDNMELTQLHQAVALNAGRAVLEVSGGVNLDTVRAIAATGVDRISIGALTKDVQAIDFSMRFYD